ncbi:MAG TPA: ATP-binding cassette domain-containing protein [Burkholderiales bacterium]|nr:ATP-binding cassette domain-containing protein [Burkholderiales bacterium]
MEKENGRRCLIEVNGLWTRFGNHTVHRDISLTVERGEVLSLVGGSGSGKTTLLRQMMGLETPYKGEVKVFGVSLQHGDADEIRRIRNRWGVLFQQGALFSALSVFDNVALPLRELKTLDEDLIRELVMLKLGMVGIEGDHVSKMPADLSGGMVKRVALARALSLEPELLFLDEPTAGLDPDRSESFVHLIEELRQELGLTVVMVTHDLDTLIALSSRVGVLCDQRIVAIGTLPEIVANSHRFICNFFQGARGKRALMAVAEALVR